MNHSLKLIQKLSKNENVHSIFLRNLVGTLPIFKLSMNASTIPKGTDPSDMKPEKVQAKVVAKIKTPLTYDDSVKSVKYITPIRAMKEYMLTSSDIENIPKYYSRSPYSWETRTLVFRRSDVENMAFEKHGGNERFEHIRKISQDIERRQRAELFSMKKFARLFSNSKSNDQAEDTQTEYIFRTGSGKVVLYAIAINSANFFAKSVAWWMTGSKSIFSEVLHSLADTINQVIIAYGLHSSLQSPDEAHPYGYIPMRNITSLISGVGIFCLGSGISFYHGISGLFHSHDIQSFQWAAFIMSGSFLSESVTLYMACSHSMQEARKRGLSFREYVVEGVDPSINVVLLEDSAALVGVFVASSAMALSYLMNSSIPDVFGSVIISGILAGVALFIVKSNTETLIGRSIPLYQKDAIMKIVDKEKIIRGTYDIKATMIGGDYIKFKAEVDIDGRELTKRYLETVSLDKLLSECQSISTKDELICFLLNHGDNVVQILGAEVNKIEDNIKKSFPSVKHIDIEIN